MPASATTPPPIARPSEGQPSPVDARIRQTRAAVKSTDVATGVGLLLVWSLVVLLVGAIADHWLVAGGFDRWGRFALFAIGFVGAALIAVNRIGPHLLHRINPLYAAREIERESPELKNSIVNLLQVRDQPNEPATVRRALERQATERLARVGEPAIDRTQLVRVAQALMAVVAAIGVYVVASPKDFFASAGRVLAPWASIAPPSRVKIDSVEPGAIEVAQGERVEIAAMITGLADDEIAEVVYSTGDQRIVDRRVPLRGAPGRLRQSTPLPPAGPDAALGLQSDVVYRIEAGDARTPNYRVDVIAAPTIAPVAVRYDYPGYTGLQDREVEGVGDLRAIEGTRVTLQAEANLPIAAAQIDIGADGRPDVRMRAEGSSATATWTLARTRDEPGETAAPYVIRFTSTDDRANNDPPQYRLEVIADLAPECTLLAPEEERIDVGLDERVRITVEARDPDFALGSVQLVGEVNGRRVLARDLLSGDGRGRFAETTIVTPRELGMQAGQELTYWVAAADSRTPKPNTATSDQKRLRVVGPADPDDRRSDERTTEQGGAGQRNEGADPSQQQSEAETPPANGQGAPDQTGAQDEQGDGEEAPAKPNQQQRPNGQEQQQPNAEPGTENQPQPNGIQAPSEGEQGQASEQNQQGGTPGPDQPGDPSQERAANPSGGDPNGGDQRRPTDQRPNGNAAQGERRDPGETPGEEQQPVARDGSNDGEAFERIQDFLKSFQQDPSGEQQGSEAKPSDTNRDRGQPSGDENPNEAQPGQQPQRAERQGERQQPSESGLENAENETGENTNESAQQGAEGGQRQRRDGNPGEQPDRENAPSPDAAGDPSGEQSNSRSSESGQDQPTGRTPDPQSGPREGTGDSGQNQAADRGAGQSADRGEGDTSGRQGEQAPSDSPTGQPAGEDSQGPRGDVPRQRPTDSEQGKRGDQPPNDSQPTGKGPGDSTEDSAQRSDESDGRPTQPGQEPGQPAGLSNRGTPFDGAAEGGEPGGDEANLEYAREQTELVLNRLEDLMKDREVDEQLLEQLGWSEADLRRFVDRWKSRRQAAQQRGVKGEAQLDRALRSLGLRPGGPTATRDAPVDDFRNLRQRARTSVPPRLRGNQERYLRSLNRASDE